MSELLPCPHCGGAPLFERTIVHATIRCPDCRASISRSIHPGIYLDYKKGEEAENRQCVEAWNTRTTTPTASELVEALRSSMALIDRLMHVHVAPDECTSYVEQSRQWFSNNGGTLAALADQQAVNRAALSNIGEA